MYWYKKVIIQYLDFSGRSRRKEYWMFTLFNMLFVLMAMLLDSLLDLALLFGLFGYFSISYYLFIIMPSIAVSVRRLHDIGKSGWYYLIAFIPYVGGILMLLAMCIEGQPQSNQWGPNPKEEED